jgi:hypothetical protein
MVYKPPVPLKLKAPPPRKKAPPPPVSSPTVSMKVTRRRGKRTPVLGNLIYAAIIVAMLFGMLPTALVLVVGGLPTLVTVVIDRHRRHYLSRCVGFMNFAGIAPYLIKIWMHHTTLAAMEMLTNPYAWLAMYGAAGAGWLIYLSAPSIAWLQVELTGARRVKVLKNRQRQLIEEWGEDVTGTPHAAGA